MLIIPAIDLMNGKCVRLTEGDYNTQKIYSDDPIDVALQFKQAGIRRIHIVDLDAAKDSYSINRKIIKEIKKETNLTIEVGGGIRTERDVQDLLYAGIDYLILGTILTEKLQTASKWIESFGDYFLAAVDVKDNRVKTRGWLKDGGLDPIAFGKELFQAGFKTAIYTDINRDGKLTGPNVDDSKTFTAKTGLRLIVSGGVSSDEDVEAISTLSYYGMVGVIIGKAYYEGKVNLKKLVDKFQKVNDA